MRFLLFNCFILCYRYIRSLGEVNDMILEENDTKSDVLGPLYYSNIVAARNMKTWRNSKPGNPYGQPRGCEDDLNQFRE